MKQSKPAPQPERRTGVWVDLAQFSELRPTFAGRRIRYLIEGAFPRLNAHGEQVPGNGLARCLAKISTRDDGRYGLWLIDLVAFDEWVDSLRCEPLPERGEATTAA